MKNAVILLTLLILPTIGSAQTQSRQRLSPETTAPTESNTTRNRVVGPKVSNHAENTKPRPVTTSEVTPGPRSEGKPSQFAWGNIPINNRTEEAAPLTPPKTIADNKAGSSVPRSVVQPTVMKLSPPVVSPLVVTPSASPASPALYVIGAGDVLDIRLSNTSAKESTLFTVLKNGAIEYPLLDRPLMVVGLTTDDVARTLTAQIKVIKTPRVTVSVRDYASHTVVISGLVDNPGTKVLRRQTMPLYALLAEASIRSEATTATIVRNGKEGLPLSLKDEQTMAQLISPGDAIRIGGGTPSSGQFVYVGGDVSAPGEKNFRIGMSMTQVLLSAGANLSTTRTARVSRRNSSGMLATEEYDVAAIAQGKLPDPPVFAGDRIEVKRAK